MKRLRFILKYFSHLFDAKNTRGHGIHSPYLYRFTQNAIYEKNPFYVFPKIELLRENLKFDERKLFVKDYGTGTDRETRVLDIAKASLKSPKWAQLLYRVVNFTKAQQVLELGGEVVGLRGHGILRSLAHPSRRSAALRSSG